MSITFLSREIKRTMNALTEASVTRALAPANASTLMEIFMPALMVTEVSVIAETVVMQ
jgi:hypothetical protein